MTDQTLAMILAVVVIDLAYLAYFLRKRKRQVSRESVPSSAPVGSHEPRRPAPRKPVLRKPAPPTREQLLSEIAGIVQEIYAGPIRTVAAVADRVEPENEQTSEETPWWRERSSLLS